MRRFQLPENADVSGIKASTKDGEKNGNMLAGGQRQAPCSNPRSTALLPLTRAGVLTLTIPKTEAAKPEATQIPVSSE